MRFIPTRVHGVLDYLAGGLLMAVPWLLRVEDQGWQVRLPEALGAGVVAYSLLTDYELGAVKMIPMPMHLGLDAMNGVLLAASPWLFRFDRRTRVPFLTPGLFEVAVASMSETTPCADQPSSARRLRYEGGPRSGPVS